MNTSIRINIITNIVLIICFSICIPVQSQSPVQQEPGWYAVKNTNFTDEWNLTGYIFSFTRILFSGAPIINNYSLFGLQGLPIGATTPVGAVYRSSVQTIDGLSRFDWNWVPRKKEYSPYEDDLGNFPMPNLHVLAWVGGPTQFAHSSGSANNVLNSLNPIF